MLRRSNAIIVPGRASLKHIIRLGADSRKIFIASNSIDNKLFIDALNKCHSQRDSLRSKFGLENKVVILYVGRIVPEKGLTFLLDAFKKLKSENNAIAFVLIGYGELQGKLQKICKTENISDVLFLGTVTDYKEIVRYYDASDIFVLPTLEDVWGFVINEAMVCGLPVVSTYASQAACEMVNVGENGYLVEKGNSKELYKVLKTLIFNAELRKQMGKNSTKIVNKQFSVKSMAEVFVQTLHYSLNNIANDLE